MLAIPAKASDDKCDWEKVLQKHLSRNYSPALVRESVALPFSFFLTNFAVGLFARRRLSSTRSSARQSPMRAAAW